jgi:hypothetical protein
MSKASASPAPAPGPAPAAVPAAKSKGQKRLDYLVAGGTAGMVARTCIAPIERIKILFQVQKGSNIGTVVSRVVKTEGLRSMWKGNSAAVIRVIPYTSIQFTSFEEFNQLLSGFRGLGDTPRRLAAGSLAGLAATTLTYPLDVVRARMALQNEGLATTRCVSVCLCVCVCACVSVCVVCVCVSMCVRIVLARRVCVSASVLVRVALFRAEEKNMERRKQSLSWFFRVFFFCVSVWCSHPLLID